jgi:preprotein translocase subunit SecG
MSIPLVFWVVIAVALAIMYAYRKIVAGGSDELVHLSDVSDAVIAKQEATARTIQQLDRVVMILAIVFVVYGIVLGGLEVYQAFNSSSPGA